MFFCFFFKSKETNSSHKSVAQTNPYYHVKVSESEVAQSCLCDPMDCSLSGASIHGIFQARVLEWSPFPSPGDLPDPGIEPRSPASQADALPSEPPEKPFEGGVFVCI